ncbi:MAG: helix-turn-helix domain-containing protein [Gammaproteobacteria bacterium]
MHKSDTVRMFRERLTETMELAQLNRSQLAQRAGIDRSTLSQLLSPDNMRLPRADTIAAIATELQVSLDWLLGLSGEEKRSAVVLQEMMQVTPRPRSPVDEGLERWHQEAAGYKIRHVPSNVPDLAKIDDVLEYEYRDFVGKTADQAIAASQEKLDYSQRPETDMEICVSHQMIAGFARGENIWRELAPEMRARQLDYMKELFASQYPSLRMYLYNGMTHYSVPYTVFGPARAAVYVGQMYFVFNTTQHIRVLTEHFDDLIRAAVVQANEVPEYIEGLRKGL